VVSFKQKTKQYFFLFIIEIIFVKSDFGLAREIQEEEQEEQDDGKQEGGAALTEYVVTRYYRAPEVMLSSHEYAKPIDIWSLGCTFAELLTGKILFQGENYIKQIKLIIDKLGK